MRGQPRRGMMACLAAVAVSIALAAPLAQPREDRIATATRATTAIFEPWLGPASSASEPLPITTSAWPPAPATMDVEAQVALAIARRYWAAAASQPVMEGAARYLKSLAVAEMFDQNFGRAGAGVESIRLFGDTWTIAFPTIRFDAPFADLSGDRTNLPPARAALAFASLDRMVGRPRLIGALRSVIDARPSTDRDLIRTLGEALSQDVTWLFDLALDPAKTMNYRIARAAVGSCSPEPCHRVDVEIEHDGAAAFNDLEVRVDFADGQAASARWDGRDFKKSFTFEGPSLPTRVRLDPDLTNLLDDNLLDQSREIDARTNVPIAKWTLRWSLWLQDVMLAYSALV